MTHFLPLFLKSSIFYFCYSPSHNLDKHIIDHCQEDENAEEDQSVTFVKYPLGEPRGFYAGCPTLASSRPMFVALSIEGLWALSMSTSGTPNAWYVTAFTHGNDLPWNAQTVLSCQCAKNEYRVPFFLSGWKPETFASPWL